MVWWFVFCMFGKVANVSKYLFSHFGGFGGGGGGGVYSCLFGFGKVYGEAGPKVPHLT